MLRVIRVLVAGRSGLCSLAPACFAKGAARRKFRHTWVRSLLLDQFLCFGPWELAIICASWTVLHYYSDYVGPVSAVLWPLCPW